MGILDAGKMISVEASNFCEKKTQLRQRHQNFKCSTEDGNFDQVLNDLFAEEKYVTICHFRHR